MKVKQSVGSVDYECHVSLVYNGQRRLGLFFII